MLDIEPVTKASEPHPTARVERVVAERGWVDVDELELLTGVVVEPTVGHWVDDTGASWTRPGVALATAIDAAGRQGSI